MLFLSPKIKSDELNQQLLDVYEQNWHFLAKIVNKNLLYISSHKPTQLFDLMQSDQVVIFPGGNSLARIEDSEENKRRDQIEKHLLEYCLKESITVLGICRGAQFVFDHFGGLVTEVSKHAGTSHSLTWQRSLFGLETITKVLSHHDYGLSTKGLPDEIEVLATDDLGWIEAFRLKNKSIYGLMWHPERQSNLEDYIEFFRSI